MVIKSKRIFNEQIEFAEFKPKSYTRRARINCTRSYRFSSSVYYGKLLFTVQIFETYRSKYHIIYCDAPIVSTKTTELTYDSLR